MKTNEVDLQLRTMADLISIIGKKQASEMYVQNDSIHKMFKNTRNKIIPSGNVCTYGVNIKKQEQ